MHALVAGTVYFAGGVAVIYLFLQQLLRLTQDDREPVLLPTPFPFLGDLLSLAMKNGEFSAVRDRFHVPIYTRRLPGRRLYVVNDLELTLSIQRQPKILTLQPELDRFAARVCGLSDKAVSIMTKDMAVWLADPTATFSFTHNMYWPSLAPGVHLDAMNRTTTASLNMSMCKIRETGRVRVQLMDWIKREITLAATDGVYGPMNPYKDPAVREAFWTFSDGVHQLARGILPFLFARKARSARDFLKDALLRYYQDGGLRQSARLTQARFEIYSAQGMPLQDITGYEAGNGLALLFNTVPTAFWTTYHILSDSHVLEDCRAEVKAVSIFNTGSDGAQIAKVDLSHLKYDCPVLLSTYNETLRYYANGLGARMVLEDHLLDGQYLLKKGALILQPKQVTHTDTGIWGEDAHRFKHKRFIPDASRKRPTPAALRSFGGGTTLCPGRNFATTEILAFVAMLIMQFDVVPAGGVWPTIRPEHQYVEMDVPRRGFDVKVDICIRKEERDRQWIFSLTGSDKSMELSVDVPINDSSSHGVSEAME